MPFTKPLVLPEFCTDDVGNGPLGALNVQTPSAYHMQYGWDYGEAPPREYFNWFMRYSYLWHGWTDQEMELMKLQLEALENKTKNTRSYFKSQW